MLRDFEHFDDYPEMAEKIKEYNNKDEQLVVYRDMGQITHIFFHSLIVDTARAFDGDEDEMGYHSYMTTCDEFWKMMEIMYERGYVLVTPYQVAYEVEAPDGNFFTYGEIRLPEGKKPIIVPSCWSNEPGMLHYEGDVWLETDFDTVLPNARLVFGAVNNECDVYLDGKHLGYHYGPFVEFAFTVENLTPGSHHLVVRTNNLHNEENTIPLSNVDWFHYGGIIRSVEVHEFDTAAVESVKLEYTLENGNAALTAKVNLRAFEEVTAPVRLLLNGEVLAEKEITL
jgi:hypothetical protein